MSVFFPLSKENLDKILNTENNNSINSYCFYEKLADYYYNTENYIAALQICYKNKDFDKLFSIIRKTNLEFITSANSYLIMKYFLEAPMSIKCKYIEVTLNISYIFIISENYSTFDEIRNSLFEYVINKNIPINQKKKLFGYMEFEHACCVYNDIDIMFNYYQKSYALIGENFFKNRVNIIDFLSMNTPSLVYAFHNKVGELDKRVFFFNDNINNYYRLTNNHNFGIENTFAAEWLYLRGRITESNFLAQNALCSAEQYGKNAVSISAYFILARIGLMLGEYTKILESLQKMRNVANEYDNTIFSSAVDFCEAHIYGVLGHNEFIKKWIVNENAQYGYDRVNITNFTNYFVTHTKCLLNDGKYNSALEFMESFIKEHKSTNHICMKIYYNMYRAIIFDAQGEHFKATNCLRKALKLATPDKLYMIFAENYALLEDMLRELYFNDEFCNDITNIADYGERICWWIQRFEQEHFYGSSIAI